MKDLEEKVGPILLLEKNRIDRALGALALGYVQLATRIWHHFDPSGERVLRGPRLVPLARTSEATGLHLVWRHTRRTINPDELPSADGAEAVDVPYLCREASRYPVLSTLKRNQTLTPSLAWEHGVPHIARDFRPWADRWEWRLAMHFARTQCEPLRRLSVTARRLLQGIMLRGDPDSVTFHPDEHPDLLGVLAPN